MQDAENGDGNDGDADGDGRAGAEPDVEPDSMEVEVGTVEGAFDLVLEEAESNPIIAADGHDGPATDVIEDADTSGVVPAHVWADGAAAEEEVPDGLPLFPAESVTDQEETSEPEPAPLADNDTLLACLKLKMQAKKLMLVSAFLDYQFCMFVMFVVLLCLLDFCNDLWFSVANMKFVALVLSFLLLSF